MNALATAPAIVPTVACSLRAGITTLVRIPWLCFQRRSCSSGQSRQFDVRRRNQASAQFSTTSNHLIN
jgi:hypothetical protein